MPIYEYRCEECGTKYEKIVFNTKTAPPPACPHCKSERVEKLFSVPGACGVANSTSSGSSGGGNCGSGFT